MQEYTKMEQCSRLSRYKGPSNSSQTVTFMPPWKAPSNGCDLFFETFLLDEASDTNVVL